MPQFLWGIFFGVIIGYIIARRYAFGGKERRERDKIRKVSATADDGVIYAAPYGDFVLIHIDKKDRAPRIKLDPESAYLFGYQLVTIAGPQHDAQSPLRAFPNTYNTRLPYIMEP